MTCSLAETVAAEIRAEMARQRKTQSDVAECLDFDRASLSLRLSGKRDFKLSELERIAEFLDVPLASLIRERAA